MIKTAVICFTKNGIDVSKKIKALASNNLYNFELFAKFDGFECTGENITFVEESIYEWTLKMQKNKYAIVFIGAMGIAVRAISKGLTDKLNDAPIIVIDELGINIIPVIAGHVGGANEMALHIAEKIGATPVITTATDIEGSFSVDLFAKENNLAIYNKDGIKKVSTKALEGKTIRISIENYPPVYSDVIISNDKTMSNQCDILLNPKGYAVGVGCKKGTSFEALNEFFIGTIKKNNIDINEIGAIASIDLKANEEGLIELCSYYRIPFITYTKEILLKAQGTFEESEFVMEKTGVGNVCERAAILLTNNRGTIIQNKCSENGMTIAIAKME